MNKFPEFLQGERITLRPVTPQDSDSLHRAIVSSYDILNQWMIWATPVVQTLEACKIWCAGAYERYLRNEEFNILICDPYNGEILGCTGLHSVDWKLKIFEIGYWGVTKYAGRGYMTEAVRLLVNYTLNEYGARRVFLTADERNVRSCEFAERLGFKLEGILHNDRIGVGGKVRNTKVYAIWT